MATDGLTFQDKAMKIGSEVRERVSPLLESLKRALGSASSNSPAAPPEPVVNELNGTAGPYE